MQGNVRFVGVQSALDRMEARAVLRLLVRADNMAAVLFMDEIYYSSHRDAALEEQVWLCACTSALSCQLESGQVYRTIINGMHRPRPPSTPAAIGVYSITMKGCLSTKQHSLEEVLSRHPDPLPSYAGGVNGQARVCR